jgi:transcriptional regulator with XRE-family HTH domain
MTPRGKREKPVEPPVDPLSPFVGPLLLHAREAAPLKQETVAKKAGISDTTLRRIENGVGPLSNDYLRAICGALKLNPDLVLLEATIGLWESLLKRLAQDPQGPIPLLRSQVLEAVDARHEAERRETDAKLLWDSLLFYKTQFINPE